MKHLFLFITALLLATGTLLADGPLLEKLRQVKEISDIRPINASPYAEAYEFYYEQLVDHQSPEKGTFKQYVQVGHRDFHAPVVAVLEGYSVHGARESELSRLFTANQVTIEHRFFKHSVPEGGIPWAALTIAQASADQHEIIQALRQKVYPDTRWISTGISKGGQTTIFHRYFYPDDVEISVPYVAPLNLSYIDPRLERNLAQLGKRLAARNTYMFLKTKNVDANIRILEFQQHCFGQLAPLTAILEETAGDNGLTFNRVGGVERAMKLVILEFPFAFWQWSGNVNEIPETNLKSFELENIEELFGYLVRVSPPNFFSDQDILDIQPFYYAALTEIGMYAYNIRDFRKYFKGEADRNTIDFRFTLPDGVEIPPFNEAQMQRVNHWLQTDADKMLFIYGGLDPWAGTAVDLKKNEKCKMFVKADANHGCRVQSFESIVRKEIIDTINAWLAGKSIETISLPGFEP